MTSAVSYGEFKRCQVLGRRQRPTSFWQAFRCNGHAVAFVRLEKASIPTLIVLRHLSPHLPWGAYFVPPLVPILP